ncbi:MULTISPECIES: hypothetical protein [Yersinia]|uniref:Acid-shock protein n=2 Tax=Yersinia bercovieri TaxID=634 RepID=A0A2G4U3Z8_YERBE|nr:MULTISPECIES: hypothetical protein [Yersinia]MCB5301787.1 hypothetical protein [Yersinia bercovieri]MDN0103026.1 hypothetical protein [Yersinia bercovieri]PHZ27486.1 hypothetical protein CS533_11220 [Yersinia bercovieri]QDW34328.1 hypothetical protein FFE93_015510 [Yersinia sp. KBS0713]QKJ07467.1 hypothetical protein HRK25_11540 [Yersinia bercovieri ATCC 43970]
MNKLAISTLLGMLLGLGGVTTQASADTSTAITPPIARGPGPVINPENSQYIEEKNAAAKVKDKVKPTNHHGKKHHKKKR